MNAAGLINLIGDAVSGYAYIGGGQRMIGTLIPDIVVAESHHDHMTVTKHPVETGAAVSDHCFLEPPTVEMQCGASNSTGQSEGYVQVVYAQLLGLQAQRTPMNVSTGKRQYSNMLITDIIVSTDETKEYALDFTVKLEYMNMVSTQTTGASGSAGVGPNGPADNSNQGNPADTGSPTDVNNQALAPADSAPSFGDANGSGVLGPTTIPADSAFGSTNTPADSVPGSNSSISTGGIQPIGTPTPGATMTPGDYTPGP